ncbi:hypothetical protein ACN6KF_001491 [Labrys sp. La1]|uniref:hypothetical protein n=1 Tax=Labrys sp. La1 TaxID=3404917 RepID=UPI003EBD0B1C
MTAVAKQAHVWERSSLDWYQEEAWCSSALARVESFEGQVWDPCCGSGTIPMMLNKAGVSAYGTDIVERRQRANPQGLDFFEDAKTREPESIPNIVSNPPYFSGKGTEAFIRAAFPLVQHKLCVFVDKRFLGGDDRAAGLYVEIPPARIWMLTPRPSCPPGEYIAAGGKVGGGTADYVWIVYDKQASFFGTTWGWLRRDAV